MQTGATSKAADMPAPTVATRTVERAAAAVPARLLAAEVEFYQAYDWCLNPYLTVQEAIDHLRGELDRLAGVPTGWQVGEVATNIFLLSGGLLNCIEEYLRGPTLRLPKRVAQTRIGSAVKRVTEAIPEIVSYQRRASVRRWRASWLASLHEFLLAYIEEPTVCHPGFAGPSNKLARQFQILLPSDLLARRLGIPSPFRRLDMTSVDVLSLGQRFMASYPDTSQRILLVGLRTSGSYFAPLLKALLKHKGYRDVELLTLEPNKGVGRWEHKQLRSFGRQNYTALIVDDPPDTAATILAAIEIARAAGFNLDKLKVVVPVRPAKRDWAKILPKSAVVLLEHDQWHKPLLLSPEIVETRLAEYFKLRNFSSAKVISSERADQLNARLSEQSSNGRGDRLKRIYEVQLMTVDGSTETRFVLAKSVGWGWLGYHSFLAGQRLADFVPPILGLRDGILYTEWIPQPAAGRLDPMERRRRIDLAAAYVAARVWHLNLQRSSAAGMDLQRQNNGTRLLEKTLSRAFGRVLTDMLVRTRLGRSLRTRPCPFPTLIDGNMKRAAWISGPAGLLKTEYEHHGMGKAAINVVDPAYDLAATILDTELSAAEESRFIETYAGESGDRRVEQRLFMYKLMAGIWSMNQAQERLLDAARDAGAQQESHERFMQAWNFLTVQTARYCGGLYSPPAEVGWRAPLVFLDVDGVIDRRLFGFPATTAAGIEALSLLSAHGISIALNTARSASEVKDYCQAYHLAGGVAEYGSYLWDAITRRGRVLIDAETAQQLDCLKRRLREIPGVFLDERHAYSIRAFTYRSRPDGLLSSMIKSMRSADVGDGVLAPVQTLIMTRLMAELGLDRLCFHQTTIDTTIIAKDLDKGSGLQALRDWVLSPQAETIAVGDHKADFPMFRAASRSFAPANIDYASQARLLGCHVLSEPFQRGLLEFATTIVSHGGRSGRGHARPSRLAADNLFDEVLQAADRSWAKNFGRAILDPDAFRIFVR